MSAPTVASTRPTSSSSRSAPTTTWTPRPGSPRAGTSSIRLPARSDCGMSSRLHRGARRGRRLWRPLQVPAGAERGGAAFHDHLSRRSVRDACEITLLMPLPSPVPPSPQTSEALLEAFAERGIVFVPVRASPRLIPAARSCCYEDGSEVPYDLFLGVPKHRAPDVVLVFRHGRGWLHTGGVPDLEDPVPGRLCRGGRGDGGCAEGRGVLRGGRPGGRGRGAGGPRPGGQPAGYDGLGSCYIEFGAGRVGRVDVDFLSGPKPTGTFRARRARSSPRRRSSARVVAPAGSVTDPATPRLRRSLTRRAGVSVID